MVFDSMMVLVSEFLACRQACLFFYIVALVKIKATGGLSIASIDLLNDSGSRDSKKSDCSSTAGPVENCTQVNGNQAALASGLCIRFMLSVRGGREGSRACIYRKYPKV